MCHLRAHSSGPDPQMQPLMQEQSSCRKASQLSACLSSSALAQQLGMSPLLLSGAGEHRTRCKAAVVRMARMQWATLLGLPRTLHTLGVTGDCSED